MPTTPEEIQRREGVARAAIKEAYGTAPSDELGPAPSLFVSHHLEEIEPAYWMQHLSTETPDPSQVLELLELKSHWGGDEEIENFDFTLPEDATQYLITVKFDKSGVVSKIAMES
jgi:hypothetical protein